MLKHEIQNIESDINRCSKKKVVIDFFLKKEKKLKT